MKRAIILGAGQSGRCMEQLLSRNEIRIVAFGDNNEKVHGYMGDIPIVSVKAAVGMKPELAVIAVLGDERCRALELQLTELGFDGERIQAGRMMKTLDLRARCVKLMKDEIAEVQGSIAELGVYRGDLAWQLNELFPDRKLYLFDTFEGFDERDILQEPDGRPRMDFSDTAEELVLGKMKHRKQVVLRKGYFPETADGLENEVFAFVSLDPDLYRPCLEGLRFFYPRMAEGGMILVHDYHSLQFEGIKRAVSEYRRECPGIRLVPLGDMHGSVVIVK